MSFQVGTSAGMWKTQLYCVSGVNQKGKRVSLRDKHKGEQALSGSLQWVTILFIMWRDTRCSPAAPRPARPDKCSCLALSALRACGNTTCPLKLYACTGSWSDILRAMELMCLPSETRKNRVQLPECTRQSVSFRYLRRTQLNVTALSTIKDDLSWCGTPQIQVSICT